MLRLYLDHNFHDQVTQGLRRRGADCLTAREDGTRTAADEILLERASELERILVTHDDDFLRIAAEWIAQGRRFAGIVYVHQGRLTIGQAIHDIELIVHAVGADEIRNTVIRVPI